LIPNSPSISPAELLNNASTYFSDVGISQRQQQPVVSPTGELLLSPTPYFSDFGTNQWQQQQSHEQHLHSCIALALRGVVAKMMEQKNAEYEPFMAVTLLGLSTANIGENDLPLLAEFLGVDDDVIRKHAAEYKRNGAAHFEALPKNWHRHYSKKSKPCLFYFSFG